MRGIFEVGDEIESIEYLGEIETIDIEVSGNNLFYANGILTHNSSIQEQNFDASHIAGGISKFNTADNVMAIFTSQSLKERGEYQIQFLKTRSSNGVGSKVSLSYNIENMRITDFAISNVNQSHTTPLHALQGQISQKKPMSIIDNKILKTGDRGSQIRGVISDLKDF